MKESELKWVRVHDSLILQYVADSTVIHHATIINPYTELTFVIERLVWAYGYRTTYTTYNLIELKNPHKTLINNIDNLTWILEYVEDKVYSP